MDRWRSVGYSMSYDDTLMNDRGLFYFCIHIYIDVMGNELGLIYLYYA